MSRKEGWEPRHADALGAYKRGDPERLIKLCGPEIEAEARYHVTRAARAEAVRERAGAA